MRQRSLLPAGVLIAAAWSTSLAYTAVIPHLQADRNVSTTHIGWIGTVGFAAVFVGQAAIAPRTARTPPRAVATVAVAITTSGALWLALADRLG